MLNIKSFLLLIFGFFIVHQLSAQVDSTNFKIELTRIELSNGYASNHLTGMTALPFAFRSNINTDDIDNSSQLLFKQNRIGATSHISLNFKINKHEFSIGHHSILGAAYSKSLYQLVFDGNAPHAGKKMDLNINAKQLTYTKLTYQGAWKSRLSTKKQSLVYRHHIGLLGISKYSSAKTKGDNYLLTSESGIDVESQLNYNYQANEQAGFKGAGLAVGTYAYSRNGATAKIFQIENLGIGFIKSGELKYSRDTAWTYSGIQFNISNNQDFNDIGDSIQNLIYKEGKSDTRFILLPVHLQYAVQSPKSSYGINYLAMPGYLPQVHYVKKFYTAKNNTYGIGAKAGGWGLLNSHLQYNHFMKKEGRTLQLQMTGLESLLLPYPSFAVQMRMDL